MRVDVRADTPALGAGAKPRFAVLRFPGSNCDQDAYYVIKDLLGCPVDYVWHQESSLDRYDVVIVPGGFAYGDYLRCGAVARFAPVMDATRRHAERGGLVLGICNGFQILCEAGLLPGALLRNSECRFVCRYVCLRVENNETPFTCAYSPGQTLKIPIAHGEGCFVCDAETERGLIMDKRVIFRYAEEDGELSARANPNGSQNNIAGIANERFNVMGLMPHPERASERILGSADGRGVFESLVTTVVSSIK